MNYVTTAKGITAAVEEIGMSTTETLQCATIESARAIKVEENLGTIETGKLSDMVIVNGNPLEDITILEDRKNLLHVIRDGRIITQQGKIIDHI